MHDILMMLLCGIGIAACAAVAILAFCAGLSLLATAAASVIAAVGSWIPTLMVIGGIAVAASSIGYGGDPP